MEDESPYLYPGTDVLRNKLGILDGLELARVERRLTDQRIGELQDHPIRGNFDANHLCAIHHHIFQDLYKWAGQFRVLEITKDSKGERQFSYAEEIALDLKIVTASLTRDDHLRNLDRATFCERAAYHFGELNTVHPVTAQRNRSYGLSWQGIPS